MKTMGEKFNELKKNLALKVEQLEQADVESPTKINKDLGFVIT